jgi:hypothetical protein
LFVVLLRNPEFDPVENVFNFIWLEREKGLSPALVIAGSIHALVSKGICSYLFP